MLRYRPFRNTDPPAIAEIWRSQPPLRGLAQPMSPAMLDRYVLSKPYFDRHGLIVALDDDRPVGFAHAGFGPTDDFARVWTELGVTCLLLTIPHPQRDLIARELLAQSENYLRGKGARILYGGGMFPLNPFYLGLYGGSELPGVLASDTVAATLFREGGYKEVDRCVVLRRELTGFRPPVNRGQMQVRRTYNVESPVFDPRCENWWEACTVGQTDRTRFFIQAPDGTRCGSVTFWDIEPLASGWGLHAAGLNQLEIAPPLRRQGLATFLVSEALRQLHQQGVTLCEVQAMQNNTAALGLYRKLGFEDVDEGIAFRKDG